MKNVRLVSAEYTDFKKIKHEVIHFEDGENFRTGKNGTGKTTLLDGFCWVLLGKNSNGNSQFRVEPYGSDDKKTSVSLVFDVDGEKVNIRKDKVKGVNYWSFNELEVKKNVFEDMLSSILPVEAIELLSDPKAFFNLHWEVRRNYLTKVFCDPVPEDSEFSFLMKSMSISDIRQSKTKQKKTANDAATRSRVIIETHEKSLSEVEQIGFEGLKKEKAGFEAEVKTLQNFDWKNFYEKETRLTTAKREYSGLVQEFKTLENRMKIESESLYEDSKGCSTCGTKVDKPVWDKLKAAREKKNSEDMDQLKKDLIAKKDANAVLIDEFNKLLSEKPSDETAKKISELTKSVSAIDAELSKENQVETLKDKIKKESDLLDGYVKEVMHIEAFMDRFNTFLTDNYYKSINDNFDGLFFDIENECKCTNAEGVEYKDFSTSEKINAGVNVISVLSKKIGISFPLWIDDRESVTELFPIDTQIINLKVV